MTTNNHPAKGPVSLDRLHQISEILSKAAAQSDGGNLGYAMADAVKVIAGVMECRKANIEYRNLAEMEYQADQAECVSRCLDELDIPKKEGEEDLSLWGRVFIYGVINADQAVEHGENLQQLRIAGNSPVTPDGWIPVSERMPEDGEHAIVFHPRDGVMQITFFFAYGKWWDSQEDDGGIPKSYFTHWQPLPAAPKQEVK